MWKSILNLTGIFIILGILNLSCSVNSEKNRKEQFIQEIQATERAFAAMALEKGVKEAFLEFAAEDAVLNRRDKIISGKDSIRKYFEKQILQNVKLQWQPEFVDVSKSGDLAYTYGPYTFSAIDTSGEKIESEGIFHTVWKRQKDGTWKYVWD